MFSHFRPCRIWLRVQDLSIFIYLSPYACNCWQRNDTLGNNTCSEMGKHLLSCSGLGRSIFLNNLLEKEEFRLQPLRDKRQPSKKVLVNGEFNVLIHFFGFCRYIFWGTDGLWLQETTTWEDFDELWSSANHWVSVVSSTVDKSLERGKTSVCPWYSRLGRKGGYVH